MDERRDKNRIRFADEANRRSEGGARLAGGERGRGSFGAWLKTQREARGVTIEAIAEASKISRRYLEALESDRFDALPAPVFVRGFLREYARIVGLDGDEVVNFYLLARPASNPRPSTSAAAEVVAERAPSSRATLLGYAALLLTLLAVFLGIAAGISWWAGKRAERSTQQRQTEAGAAGVAAAASNARREDVPSGETALAQPSAETFSAVPDRSTDLPGTGGLRVDLEFLQDCWVEVVVDGRRRESELKAGGESLAIEATDYVLLTLGNAPAVRVEVDGEPYPLAQAGSRVVRELRIDRRASVPESGAAALPPSR